LIAWWSWVEQASKRSRDSVIAVAAAVAAVVVAAAAAVIMARPIG